MRIALACALASGCGSLPELGEIGRPPPLEQQVGAGEATLLDRHLATMRRITDAPLVAGNSARLLVDGPASYEVTFRAIRAARDHVNVETYIFEADEVGQRLAALLIEKQQQGVQVNLLYDAVGSLGTPAEFFERMRASGINVCAFNPLLPERGRAANPNQRDHRKQVVVDGRVAVSGGINFSSVYSSGSSTGRSEPPPSATSGWRDTNIEIRGPAVAQFQKLFLASWEKQQGAPLASREYFPPLATQGDKVVRVIGSSSDGEQSLTYLALLSAIRESVQSVDLTAAYFVPDGEILDALTEAARRGVAVTLLLPGFSDSWMVFQAGRSYYAELLSAGVGIYELRGALLHSKTAVIDGVWSTVGSTNIDWRSLLHNDELNTIVLGEDFGSDMKRMFDADLKDATPIDPASWEARGVIEKLKERSARLLRYWL
jgi:cardiolipin synthase